MSLKRVRIVAIVGGVDDDLKVVIQFLTDIPAQLCGHDPFGIGVEASDAEVDFVLVIENADFGPFSWSLSFVRLALQEVRNRSGLRPDWIIERAIQPWSSINAACLRSSKRFLGPYLPPGRL